MIFRIIKNLIRRDSQTVKLKKAAKKGGIIAAYKKSHKAIESLRQYDRGEKQILTPNLTDLMRNL